MEYNKNPISIENDSFSIITREAGALLDRFSEEELPIVKRVIHTTADFEYAELIEFHPDAIRVAKELFKNGCEIYTDTSMIMQGVNRRREKFGIELTNYVHDEDVYEIAAREGVTRSMAGIVKAVNKGVNVFAIGNAPTAIFKLRDLIEAGLKKPALIIGVPVGFVGAAESKEILSDLGVPYIRVNGRKGGSPVAASIINAILKELDESK